MAVTTPTAITYESEDVHPFISSSVRRRHKSLPIYRSTDTLPDNGTDHFHSHITAPILINPDDDGSELILSPASCHALLLSDNATKFASRLSRLLSQISAMITLLYASLLPILTATFRIICAIVKNYKYFRGTVSVLVKIASYNNAQLFEVLDDFVRRVVLKREERSLWKTVGVLSFLAFLTWAFLHDWDWEVTETIFYNFILICSLFVSEADFAEFESRHPLLAQIKGATINVVRLDYFIKLGTMLLKMGIFVLPAGWLDYSEKERVFQLVEYTSQLSRILLPIQFWLLLGTDGLALSSLPNWIFTIPFTAIYLYCKCIHEIKPRLQNWWGAVESFLPWEEAAGSGVACETLDVESRGSIQEDCAICYDTVVNPKVLPSSHVYCKGCLDRWFDQLRMMNVKTTCPLCTAEVDDEASNKKYCDGSTALWVVVF